MFMSGFDSIFAVGGSNRHRQLRPIMQSQRLWKVADRNARQTLKGSGRQAFRPLHNHSVFRKSISESGAR